MSNITIQRYTDPTLLESWSGVIEDDDATWIIFLDEKGRPSLYWGERDEKGGVIGEPVVLSK